MRVLLIEDDSATAQSIELMLKVENFNVYTTDLGGEGIDLGKLYEYDIILRNCPGAEGGLGQPERLHQGFRAAVQGFDDVPALLPCSGEEGADGREVVRSLH